jgi:4-hydroxybenzoate polyprenyltransferase
VLAGGALATPQAAAALAGVSLLYIAGMYLNDAFDRAFDRKHRTERPIPAGAVSARTVFVTGFGLLAAGVALLALCGLYAAMAGVALALLIVVYDAWHKDNPAGPVLMGGCRLLAYVSAGLAVAPAVPPALWIAALVSFSYLIGLTYIAKQETLQRVGNLWPLIFLAAPLAYGAAYAPSRPLVVLLTLALAGWGGVLVWRLLRQGRSAIPSVVVGLIAGISLVDALFAAAHDAPAVAALAVAAVVVTLGLQRFVSGT